MIRDRDQAFAQDTSMEVGKLKRTDLAHRIDVINSSKADLMISIHMNAMSDGRWRGAQTFYYPKNPDNKQLAESIQNSLKAVLQNTKREAKGVTSLYLLRKIEIPGVIVECGFLSNAEEEKLLQSPIYQDQVAYAIYLGVLDYLNR